MKILEHNVETGEVIERDATVEELAQMEIDAAKYRYMPVSLKKFSYWSFTCSHQPLIAFR